MTITLSIDDREFRQAMAEAEKATGKTTVVILREQMALWVADLVKKTVDRKGQKHQADRIISDTMKIIAPINVPAALESWRKAFEETGKSEIYRTNKRGQTYKMSEEQSGNKVVTDASVVKSFHRSNRDSRGRVKGKARAGNEWYPGRILVSERLFNKHVRELKRHIGKTKSGWIAGVNLFKAKVQSMVTRNAEFGARYGTAGDTLKADSISGYAFAENKVPWIRDVDRMMDVTLNTRVKDLRTGKYIARWAKAMKAQNASVS